MADNLIIVEEKYRYSYMPVKEYQYSWIYKIPVQCTVGLSDDSLQFWIGENNEHKWGIDVYFGGIDDDSEDYISFRIRSYSGDEINTDPNFEARAKLSIIDKNNKPKMEQSLIITNQNLQMCQFKKFIKRNYLLSLPNLVSNNELKLMCQFSLNVDDEQVSHSISPWATLHYRNVQMNNYEKMFDNPQFSDFQFVIGDTRIKVHKCILAAHSNVLAAMFQSNMIEKNSNEVNIEDVEENVMKQLLRFVYVGEVKDIDDFTDKLFIAADKYELNELKNYCEEELIKKLTVNNLCETLFFVDKYDTTKLKDAAIEFVIHNSKILSAVEDFTKSIENLSSILLAKVISAFVDNSK